MSLNDFAFNRRGLFIYKSAHAFTASGREVKPQMNTWKARRDGVIVAYADSPKKLIELFPSAEVSE